jgi:diguanylate cyclase (GGDEF)-like protein
MKKLDVCNRIQAVSEAINLNLITPRKFKNAVKEKLLLNITDEPTGLYNRRYLMEHIKKEIKRARRHSRAFSVAIIGIKGSNSFGRFEKDAILKKFAECLIKAVRTTDIVGRMGGERFCIIMPEIEKKGTVAFTKRLLHEIVSKNCCPHKILLNEGTATFPEDGETCREIIRKAESLLLKK